MHAAQRKTLIIEAVSRTGFISYRDLEAQLDASPATIRRDLTRLEEDGQIERVHGGAKLPGNDRHTVLQQSLTGTPFEKSMSENLAAKRAIGEAAAALCQPSDGVIIDGGTTTFQMCPHLAGLKLQVLTNSLHIVNALLPQLDTSILVPSGAVFREQNIILAPGGEESMPQFHASKLFMGAASVSRRGLMQHDAVLVASQRRLIEHADQVIVLVDSSKFSGSSGAIVCPLDQIDIVVTDEGLPADATAMLNDQGIRTILAS
jgi:DeoR family ulaG and ulaABCDEF operon transcriptional repressor